MSLFCDDGCFPVAHHYSTKRRSSRADGSSFEVASVAARSAKDKYSMKVPTPFGTVKFNESHARHAAKGSRAKANRFSAASNIGISQGDFIAARIVLLEPKLVQRLILMGTSMYPGIDELCNEMLF
ncbi:unnamed protein product [Adineta steineri]|uniref:Uncharacterized protein n=2 Tax=Adineta steineri TaxID=433720 RepID=A0A819BNS6_9BILA|nr:unnamed protein product [Adineta steineri]